jgi:O-antigen/teichoic acid export membrane protein
MTREPQALGDMRKVAHGGVLMLFASVLGNGLSYLYSIFLARSLDPGDFGAYVLGLTIFNIAVLTAPLGFETGALRFISLSLGRGDRDAARRTIVQIMTLVLLSGLAAGVLLVLASSWLGNSVYQNTQLARIMPWFAAAVPLAVFSAVLLDVIRSFQLVRYTVLVRYLWEPGGRFLLAAVLLWAGFAVGGVLAALLLTSACSALIAVVAARHVAGFDTAGTPAFSSRGLGSLFMYCLPLTVSSVFGVIAPRSDMLILGAWVVPEQVGVYSVVSQTAAILALILAAFNTMCTPVMGEIAATHDLRRLQPLYSTVVRWITACAVPLLGLFVVFGADILTLFGRRFTGGATALVILAAGQLIYCVLGLSGTVLLMFGHSRKVMLNSVLLAVFLIGSNLLLVPHFGIVGSAAAVAISNAAFGAINAWQVHRLYGVQPLAWGLMKPLGAGACAGLMAWSVKGLVAPALLPLVVVVAAVIYIAVLFVLRFDAADRELFGALRARIRPA